MWGHNETFSCDFNRTKISVTVFQYTKTKKTLSVR